MSSGANTDDISGAIVDVAHDGSFDLIAIGRREFREVRALLSEPIVHKIITRRIAVFY